MTVSSFDVPDIECEGCASAIRNALGRVAGIAETQVQVGEKTVTVTHGSELTREAIAHALDRIGFPPGDLRNQPGS